MRARSDLSRCTRAQEENREVARAGEVPAASLARQGESQGGEGHLVRAGAAATALARRSRGGLSPVALAPDARGGDDVATDARGEPRRPDPRPRDRAERLKGRRRRRRGTRRRGSLCAQARRKGRKCLKAPAS